MYVAAPLTYGLLDTVTGGPNVSYVMGLQWRAQGPSHMYHLGLSPMTFSEVVSPCIAPLPYPSHHPLALPRHGWPQRAAASRWEEGIGQVVGVRLDGLPRSDKSLGGGGTEPEWSQ